MKDGHLFILAGQRKGTWQVGNNGEQWLLENHYPLPTEDEFVYLDAGTFSLLKDNGYIYIYGIQYDHNGIDVELDTEKKYERDAKGLPLLLQLEARQEPAWELYLDLSYLNEDVWMELDSHHTNEITASNARPISRRQLIYSHNLLRVYPFQHTYLIFSKSSDDSNRPFQRLKRAPETTGLNNNWQGNIFLERTTHSGIWQRSVFGSTVSFSGELLWLAKHDCKIDWPGQAEKVGSIYLDWQLWHLTIKDTVPISWESIQTWFKYRTIDVVPQRQRLEIASLPSAITEDGQFIIKPGRSTWIVCYPPRSHIQGIFKEFTLLAEQTPFNLHHSNPSSASTSARYPADRINYFSWSAYQPGNYRIRVKGDASAEPLLLKVDTPPISQPPWLSGLSCTITSPEHKHIFHAFNNSLDYQEEFYLLDLFDRQELATLDWIYEPEGLPIHVTWHCVPDNCLQRASHYRIQSGEELSKIWREQIVPNFSEDIRVKVILDGESYGSIELSILLPQRQRIETAWCNDKRLVAQFTWLCRVIMGKNSQKTIPMPVLVRKTLLELSTQVNEIASFRTALERLALANTIPAWVLFRLQTLIAEVGNMKAKDSPL